MSAAALRSQTAKIQELAGRLMLAEASLGFGVAVMHGTRFAWANPAYEQLTGYSLDDLVALPNALAIIPPSELPRMAELQAQFLRGEPLPSSFETRVVHKDGHAIDVEACVQMLVDPAPGVLFCVRDIGETKRLNRELQAKDRILVESQRISGLGVYVWELESGNVTLNDKMFEAWGLPRHELPQAPAPTGAGLYSIAAEAFRQFIKPIHPEDQAVVKAASDRMFKVDGPTECEFRIARADGSVRRLRHTAALERDEAGEPRRVIGTIQDITQEYEGVLANRLVQKFFEDIVEGSFSQAQQRDYGRGLAKSAGARDLPALLASYATLGLGTFRISSITSERSVFSASDLVGSRRPGRSVGCHLAVGFLEGAVAAATGRVALGTETSCRRRGDAECSFTIASRT